MSGRGGSNALPNLAENRDVPIPGTARLPQGGIAPPLITIITIITAMIATKCDWIFKNFLGSKVSKADDEG